MKVISKTMTKATIIPPWCGPHTELFWGYHPVERREYNDGVVAYLYESTAEVPRYRVLVFDRAVGWSAGFYVHDNDNTAWAIRHFRSGKRADHVQRRLMGRPL